MDSTRLLDAIGWKVLRALQRNARMSFSDLGRHVGLSSPAVAERVRRMEEAGIITGYRPQLSVEKLGRSITAFIRLLTPGHMTHARFGAWVSQLPEVLECHRVTGSEGYIMKIAVGSVEHLERFIDQLRPYGQSTSAIVLSSPVEHRMIEQALPEDRRKRTLAGQTLRSAAPG